MVLSIKNDEVDRLARELVAVTGQSLTEAVRSALQEQLDRERVRRGPAKADKLRRLIEEIKALPVLDGRPAEQIIGYDERGLPA